MLSVGYSDDRFATVLVAESDNTVTIEHDALLLDEVLRSRTFERTASLRKLLIYLWENRHADVSEYAIAIEALGRPANFDSKIDATVRVQIGRLRRMLDKFYAEEGVAHSRRAAIPVGSHRLVFTPYTEESGSLLTTTSGRSLLSPPEGTTSIEGVENRPLITPAIGRAILTLLVICAALLSTLLLRTHTGQTSALKKEPPAFWRRILDNGKSTRIVLPAPLFFSWRSTNSSVMVRDIEVNRTEQLDSSSILKDLQNQHGVPNVWQNYTVASDTFASLRLARFLDGFGVRTSFSSSTDSPQEIVDHENIVTFGTKNSLVGYQSDLDRLTFRMGPHESYVSDLTLPGAEQKRFQFVNEGASRSIVPGIVALLPKGNNGSRILLLQGSQTMALIAYLTSEDGMRELEAASTDRNNPYFEAVVLSEVNMGTPLQNRLGAYRPFIEGKTPSPNISAQLLRPTKH